MGQQLIYAADLATVIEGPVVVGGEEAHHAVRVRRLAVGDAVRLCDGRGLIVEARIERTRKTREGEWELVLERTGGGGLERAAPAVHVFASAPKGDRVAEMIDGLSQAGAASWRPLLTQRTQVDPRAGKLERLRRIAVESLKQCGRAWVMEIGEPATLEEALNVGGRVIVADASGRPFVREGGDSASLLIGPEGGWTPEELERARGAGATIARFGVHTMRVETAAVVATAMLMQGG